MADLPVLDPDSPKARSRHLLALPPNVEPDELEVLAMSRFGRVLWEQEEPEQPKARTGLIPTVSAAFGIRQAPILMPRLRLGRLSSLVGPYQLQPSSAMALGLPPTSDTVWLVGTPTERGEKPFAGGGDRDGLRRAFPDGLPIREEERVVRWLVAAARRLGGAVRIHDNGVVIVPDPDAAVNLTLLTTEWPTKDEALHHVRRVAPRAKLSGQAEPAAWDGPRVDRNPRGRHARPSPLPTDLSSRRTKEVLDEHGVSDAAVRRNLLAEAEAYDELMSQQATENYGIEIDLSLDGMVEVLPERLAEPPMVLRDAPWATDGLVALHVYWHPTDQEQAHAERPSALHRVARGRAVPVVNATAFALWEAFGGEIADEAEFLIHPDDLQPDSRA